MDINGLRREKNVLMSRTNSEGPDQPAHFLCIDTSCRAVATNSERSWSDNADLKADLTESSPSAYGVQVLFS